MILPGATIGILGGGQLGRMLILAGRPLGFHFHVYCPEQDSTAANVADSFIRASYDDVDALNRFADCVDCITFEFENIPSETLRILSNKKPIFPNTNVLHVCQHRQREKDFLKAEKFPCATFEYASDANSLINAINKIGYPCVIKTAAFGYDGKGQIKIESSSEISDPKELWNQLGSPERVVIEEWIIHKGEYSVVCARNAEGLISTFPLAQNVHINHILHSSSAPAPIKDSISNEATRLAKQIAERLNVVGLIAIEFFLNQEDKLIINEMAPRPHNSGHYTMDACVTSQFQQHIRAITGLPFGETSIHTPCVMFNILGDLWKETTPNWEKLLSEPSAQLHLYDKGEPRRGRKMGHFNVLNKNLLKAEESAKALFLELKKQ